MAQNALYMTPHTRLMTSQYSTHDIKSIISHLTPIISDSTSIVSLSSHPDYRSYKPYFMYDNTGAIYMTSYELHMTSYPRLMISYHADITPTLFLASHPGYLSSLPL